MEVINLKESIYKILKLIAKKYECEIPVLLAIFAFCILLQETFLLPICVQHTSKVLLLLKLSVSLNIGLLSWVILLYLKIRKSSKKIKWVLNHKTGWLQHPDKPDFVICRKCYYHYDNEIELPGKHEFYSCKICNVCGTSYSFPLNMW